MRCWLSLQALLLLAAAAAAAHAEASSGDPRIEHFVVLFMENRPADHFFGCMNLPGFDSGVGKPIWKDPDDHSKGSVAMSCGKAKNVCRRHGGNYSLFSGKFKPGARHVAAFPYSAQSNDNAYANGGEGVSIEAFSPEQLPVKAALAKEYGVFNKFFSSVPSMSTPNHLFAQSATSCGVAENLLYSQCGGNKSTFPQVTIYDSLALANASFGFYINASNPDLWEIVRGGWAENSCVF